MCGGTQKLGTSLELSFECIPETWRGGVTHIGPASALLSTRLGAIKLTILHCIRARRSRNCEDFPMAYFTIGHSTRPALEFVDLLRHAEAELVVDVRSI